MKKNMKKISMWLFAIIAGVSMSAMVACSDDDDNNGDNPGDGKVDPSTIATANLIAYFPFEDAVSPEVGAGITYASKGASTSFAAGRRGKAFVGKDDGTSFLVFNLGSGNKLTAATEYTLAGWLRLPKADAARGIFHVNGGDPGMGSLGLFTDNSNNFEGDSVNIKTYLFNTTTDWKGQDYVSHAYLANVWTHVVVLYRKSTSTIELYANGKLLASNPRFGGPDPDDNPDTDNQPALGSLTLDPASNKIYFGKWHDEGNPEDWKKSPAVSIDEFRIYDKALTEAEVQSLYDAEVSQVE
jgi:hypothetical protein